METNMVATVWEQQEVVRLLKGQPGTQYQEADEVNRTIMRDWVRGLLQTTVATVEFTKSDGSIRKMNCTLDPNRLPLPIMVGIPPTVDGIPKKPRKEPDQESIRVFDVDLKEWRSFRFDRLQNISATMDWNNK